MDALAGRRRSRSTRPRRARAATASRSSVCFGGRDVALPRGDRLRLVLRPEPRGSRAPASRPRSRRAARRDVGHCVQRCRGTSAKDPPVRHQEIDDADRRRPRACSPAPAARRAMPTSHAISAALPAIEIRPLASGIGAAGSTTDDGTAVATVRSIHVHRSCQRKLWRTASSTETQRGRQPGPAAQARSARASAAICTRKPSTPTATKGANARGGGRPHAVSPRSADGAPQADASRAVAAAGGCGSGSCR